MIDKNTIAQAQHLATNMLKHHAKLLGQNEPAVLNNFLRQAANKTMYRKITESQCLKIVNIARAVNQKVYKGKKA